jgi:hypothetical protein
MTDYLTGLALRNKRYGWGIRPRLPTRFEPGRGTGLPSVEGLREKPKTTAGHRPLISVPHELPAEEREREQPAVPSGTRHITRSAASGRHVVTETIGADSPRGYPKLEKTLASWGTQKPLPENIIMAEKRDVQENSSGKSLQRNRTDKLLPVRSSLKAAVPDEEQRAAAEQRLPEPGTGKRGKARAPVAETMPVGRKENILPEKPLIRAVSYPAGPARRERIITPEDIRHYSPEPGAKNGKIPSLEPRVQVTIGRIEIRSVPRREAQERRHVLPELNLSGYLHYRDRRVAK